MSILTASESNAFMSFLTSMDYNPSTASPDEYLIPEWDLYTANTDLIIQASGKEALAQATKNLMSLDALATGKISRPDLQLHHLPSSSYKHPMQYPLTLRTTVDPAAFSFTRSPPPADDVPSYASSSVSSTDSAPSPSTPTELLSPPIFPSPRTSLKRAAPAPSASSSNKRARPSSAPTTSSSSGSGSKPALLSATQKKANHIQSEQKRRANIRRGYEALCDAVPSLRDGSMLTSEGVDGLNKIKKKRSSTDTSNNSDCRAVPRSENVVLQKCQSTI